MFINLKFSVFALFISLYPISNDVDSYFQTYRKDFVTNYVLEKQIVQNNTIESLIDNLTNYYNDSIVQIRQKAYYLTYKKGLQKDVDKKRAVSILLNGCNDKDGGIVGQNLEFLKNFHLEDYDEKSIQLINSKLLNHRIPHYKGFVLLAGFLNTGKDILFQKLLDESVPYNIKWQISLSLARMGNAEQLSYCMRGFKAQKINDSFVDNVMSNIIYMRQKEGIDYCITVLNSDEKLCRSLNPDLSESIICGYRVIEALTSVIVDIPASLDDSGFLKTNDYEKMLNDVRLWFEQNPNYQIRKNTF